MKLSRHSLIWGLAGVLIGAAGLIVIRMILYSPQTTHYHANFALYVNGERHEFEDFTFYEEVTQCGTEEQDPARRVHMHDFVNDVVHVHDDEVTWGHFFDVLGYELGDSSVADNKQVYVDGSGGDLTFILNGERVESIYRTVIGSEDRLLINFGNEETPKLTERYEEVGKSARNMNTKADPAACSGSEVDTSLWGRLKKAVTY